MLPGESRGQIVTLEGADDFLKSTIEAAALCACGVPIQMFKSPRESTGQIEWRFEFKPQAPVQVTGDPAAEYRVFDTQFTGAALSANQLMHLHRFGLLEEKDPTHPFLDALRALRNRERFLRWIMGRQPCQLVKHPKCDRWQYESMPLAALPAAMTAELHPTHELKTVCALGVFGVPCVSVSGIFPDSVFHVAGLGFAGDTTPPETPQLARDFASGALDQRDPAHPYFIAYSAIETMQKLKRMMNHEPAVVWLEKPKSKAGRSAFIRADATSKARDIVWRHFRRGE